MKAGGPIFKEKVCVHCSRPFWLGASGLDYLLTQRYHFLCRVFAEVQVLFVTPSELTCPFPGITAQIPHQLQASDVAALNSWCKRKNFRIHYAFLNETAGIVQHLDGLKICEISDVWHLRHDAFAKFGYPHGADKLGELQAMGVHDIIFALNPGEVEYLRKNGVKQATQLLPCAQFQEAPPVSGAGEAGMIGSVNHPNTDGLRQLISLISRIKRFVLAGDICDLSHLINSRSLGISCLGVLKDVRQFYRQVNTVVSPVRFGTGLKIKVLEAIAHGKPILATPHSVEGFPDGVEQLVCVKADVHAWTDLDLMEAGSMHSQQDQRHFIDQHFSDAALSEKLRVVL